MRAESTCSRFRAELSARMDGELSESASVELQAHLQDCADCTAFEAGLHSLRRTLRLAPVGEVPDVAPRVLRAISESSHDGPRELRLKLASISAVAAALVVLASSLPVLDRDPKIANASEVTRRAFSAALSLDAYSATFDITERTWHPSIPERTFRADIWYRSPEDLKLRVRDQTDLPEGAWPANEVDLIARPSRSWIREPYSCPPQALPGCAIEAGVEERTIVARQPFDGTSTAPTEIVLPLETLSTSDAFAVAGPASVGGREALHVVLTYRQAHPLIDALQVGGSWARLLPLDRVDLWLERDTWFPLRFEVSRPGLDLPILEVQASEFQSHRTLPDDLFEAPVGGSVRDSGFRTGALELPTEVAPTHLAGLEPYRSGTSGDASVHTYADGLAYLKISARKGSHPLDLPAETVQLRKGSFGLYRPAEPNLGRRVDLVGRGWSVRLESNLRREELLSVAASIPMDGRPPQPIRTSEGVITPLTPEELGAIGTVLLPSRLPPGYGPSAAQMTQTGPATTVSVVFFAEESALEGTEIRLFQSSGISMLTPSSEDLSAVTVDGSPGRWSPERGELEWIDADGIYRSIEAPSFDLASVLSIAESLR